MFKQKSNKIFPEVKFNTNDPIQARIFENYLNLKKNKMKINKNNKKISKKNK